MSTLLVLLMLLGVLLWLWQASLRAWETAREAGARACRESNVQLLDDTVALDSLWPRRDRTGRWYLERIYLFEFTDTGATRRTGRLIMIGDRVEVVQMEGGDLIIP
jgi:membrane protein implicated in regulation of membrane protease activity